MSRRRVYTLVSLGLAAAALCAGLFVVGATRGQREIGQQLFLGERALRAHIDGHADTLPTQAAACVNCHAGAQAIGGVLTGAALTELQARRGGPASRYDEAAFCRLLQQGIDPAWVLVARTMPRYTVDAEHCEALWNHVRTL